MPYSSDKQRKWAHTDSAKKAGFPTEEFDEASKGKKLPPKMADGGLVQEQQPDEFTQDVKSGVNGDMDEVKDFIMNMFGKAQQGPVVEDSNLQGFHDLMAANQGIPNSDGQQSGAIGGYAHGGIAFGDKEKSGPGLNTVPHEKYADGGFPGLDDFDVNTGDSSTLKMNGANSSPLPQSPPPPPVPMGGATGSWAPAQHTFNPASGMPPTPPQSPVLAPQAPQVNPNAIQDYLGAQKAQLDKYGPDQQMAVTNQLIQQRQGLGSKLPVALGGLADSIMQGVARAGNPGFANRIQGQQNELANQKIGAMEKAGTQNVQQTQAKMQLDAIDATSPLSKAKQQEYTPLLSKLGYNSSQIGKMSASDIESATNLMAQFGGKQIEAIIKQFELGLEAKKVQETGRHNQAEEAAKGEETGVNAAKEIMNGSKIPGVPPTHEAKLGAEKVLEKAAGVQGGAQSNVMTATNPTTGHQITSTDGGQTWH